MVGSENTLVNSGFARMAAQTQSRIHPVRVMIVDDSLMVRSALTRTIDAAHDLEVVCKTSSAELALKQLRKIRADVVLLDLEMPGMGGLLAVPKILEQNPDTQILVVSTLAQAGAEAALAALSMGAADTMPKPRAGGFGPAYCEILLTKIRALGRPARKSAGQKASANLQFTRPLARNHPELLAIGASTGGIQSLCMLLENIPASFRLPIVVTQHLPASFMTVFARQLEVAACRKAYVAQDAMTIERGHIYVAPGTGHLNITKSPAGLACKITRQAMPSGCVPSVDPMFTTAAEATGGHVLGIVLSGMGKDGAAGAADLVSHGGTIFAQDHDSSAVWGMPGAVTELGLASAVLPPVKLAEKILAASGSAAWK